MTRPPPRFCLLTAALLAGCASLTDSTPAEPPGNLLVNGSFETWGEAGPFGWEIRQPGHNERLESEGGALHGKVAANVICLHPDDSVLLEQTVPVKTPGLYRAQVFVRPIMPLRGSWLIVECISTGGKRQEAARRELKGQLAEWRPVSCTVVVPEGTMALRFALQIGPNATGEASLDAARLELMK